MKKRGNVLREPRGGLGLLMIEGRQFPFSPDSVWKSKLAPRPGLLVDVELDLNSQITAIVAVAEPDSADLTGAAGDGPESTGFLKLVAKLLGKNRATARESS